MHKKRIFERVFLIMVGIVVLCVTTANAEVTDRTVYTTATADKIEDIDRSSKTLDNFNDNGVLNCWGGLTGVFSGNGGTSSFSNTTVDPYEGQFCLKLDYNVTLKDSYTGYNSLMDDYNLNSVHRLFLRVRGNAGNELFKVELKNSSGQTAAVYINDFLLTGSSVTTGWNTAMIPRDNFVNMTEWSEGEEFVVTFERTASSFNGSPLQGTIYLDEIRFSTTTPSIVYVDRFSDKVNRCMLGGIMGAMESCSESYTTASGTYGDAPNGLLLQYALPKSGWGGAYFIFGGGVPGNTPVSHDFSRFYYLKFWVKAMSSTQNPKVMKIELVDDDGARTSSVSSISSDAQTVVVPLSSFSDLKKKSIKQLNFVFPYKEIYEAGGYTTGGIYIDDIRFDTTN